MRAWTLVCLSVSLVACDDEIGLYGLDASRPDVLAERDDSDSGGSGTAAGGGQSGSSGAGGGGGTGALAGASGGPSDAASD